MKKELITFKGVKEGIFINTIGGDLAAIKEELAAKMDTASKFYEGIKLLGIKSEELSDEEQKELKLILKYKYDLKIEEDIILDLMEKPEANQITDCGMTKFFQGTIRSGQVIEYEGNIVIIGDVNPGAFIKAKGNIIILGSLRGVAQAGMEGNLEAVVAAYNLQPMQLRIGEIIARPPDEIEGSFKMPEVAKIQKGEVVIEPYLPNK